ncbi:DJ-1/PfpI family protein [Fodinicola acaciae]|uniref:DJ-1/PfpI family protein n=1 Tax=Fodinicola acaciae TaxID=2681555 RepID=UPI0013D56960|nr:DJ-1/PfpI family protein [Fodinicola acaciae]
MQIAFVLYPGITALDLIGPYEVLRSLPGAEVRFVSNERGPVTADSEVLTLMSTHSYAETPRPDILLVPGSATNSMGILEDKELIDWVVEAHRTTTWTTSVCSGALVLAKAGILNGLPATTHWMVQEGLRHFGAEPRPDERIVRSGRIVTAAGVSAGIDLGLWLVGEIAGRERAEATQLIIEYDPRPPYDTGHVSKASDATIEGARAVFLDMAGIHD